MPDLTRRLLALSPCVLIVLAACGASGEGTGGPVPDEATLRASVDRASGQIVLPLERFHVSAVEQNELWAAQSLAMARCVQAQGVPYEPTDQVAVPSESASRTYGVWSEEEAAQYGYGLPDAADEDVTDEDVTDEVSAEPVLSDEDIAVVGECFESDGVQRFESSTIVPGFDYAEQTAGLTARVLDSDEADEAFADWEACLAEHGLEVDPSVSPWAIAGTSMEPTESNIRVALLDVGCKESTRFVERLADLEAAAQAPVIRDHLAELQEMRAEADSMLADAREYLATGTS